MYINVLTIVATRPTIPPAHSNTTAVWAVPRANGSCGVHRRIYSLSACAMICYVIITQQLDRRPPVLQTLSARTTRLDLSTFTQNRRSLSFVSGTKQTKRIEYILIATSTPASFVKSSGGWLKIKRRGEPSQLSRYLRTPHSALNRTGEQKTNNKAKSFFFRRFLCKSFSAASFLCYPDHRPPSHRPSHAPPHRSKTVTSSFPLSFRALLSDSLTTCADSYHTKRNIHCSRGDSSGRARMRAAGGGKGKIYTPSA